MLSYEWVDFVLYPITPEKVTCLADRIDTRFAVDVGKKYEYEEILERGMLFNWDQYPANFNNRFEAIQITDSGDVHIWAAEWVYKLMRIDIEKFAGLPRDPSVLLGGIQEKLVSKTWVDFVCYPHDPYKITSLEERVDTRFAVDISKEYKHEEILERGILFNWDQLPMLPGDEPDKQFEDQDL